MKILIEGNKARYDKFMPELEFRNQLELIFCERGSSNEQRLAAGHDAEILLVDAISKVDRDLIQRIPNLKMIHSEGVAYNGIDLQAAKERGIYVCNNKGCNAGAVAEQAVMLMLELLRQGVSGDRAVREGRQMEVKEYSMVHGIQELGECKVGLIGFGDIAQATAKRLHAFGCELYYHSPHRKSREVEEESYADYLELEKLLPLCDIVSIHCAVTEETFGMVNREFLSRMKPGSYLINTARGEIVDNEALRQAIIEGKLAGAGLDTLYPEPTPADHPLVDMPSDCRDRIVLAPHLGGITTGSFRRAHSNMWNSVRLVLNGQRPNHIVNGL